MGKKIIEEMDADSFDPEIQGAVQKAVNVFVALFKAGEQTGNEKGREGWNMDCVLEVESKDGEHFRIEIVKVDK